MTDVVERARAALEGITRYCFYFKERAGDMADVLGADFSLPT